MRHISSIRTPSYELARALKECESTRKNSLASGVNIELLSKETSGEMAGELRSRFFRESGKQELVHFLELLLCVHTNDSFFSIRDYALSTYFVYYHGESVRFYQYLEGMLQAEFLEYEHQVLICEPRLSRPQLRKISRFDDLQEVDEYIKEINQIGREKDGFYNGVHVYICDLAPESGAGTFAQEEREFWPFLQFNILVMLSILAEGQHAVLRIKGSFTHKTSEYIYLLKMAFNRLNFQKNLLSNPFTHDKYVICENFNKDNGKAIAAYLYDNYRLLAKHQDERLLVDPKVTFANDFQKNIATYNDSTPIMKYLKELAPEYLANSNLNIYPNKDALIKKLEELRVRNIKEAIEEIAAAIPEAAERKEEVKAKEIVEKKAVEMNIDLFAIIDAQAKQRTVEYNDISKKKSDNMEDLVDKYVSRGEKSMKEKKERSKKKKAEKEEE